MEGTKYLLILILNDSAPNIQATLLYLSYIRTLLRDPELCYCSIKSRGNGLVQFNISIASEPLLLFFFFLLYSSVLSSESNVKNNSRLGDTSYDISIYLYYQNMQEGMLSLFISMVIPQLLVHTFKIIYCKPYELSFITGNSHGSIFYVMKGEWIQWKQHPDCVFCSSESSN